MFSRLRRRITVLALCGFATLANAAWPESTITLIVPWAAGGSTDILARTLSEQLTKSLGQPVIVDNRAGASGTMSTHAMNPALMPGMPFRGVEDFTPIARIANVVNTMVINPSVPAKNLAEFIAYAKATPGKVAYASAGAGSTNHLSAVLFEKAAGVQMLHVPYKGGAPAVLDTVGNQTQVLFSAGTQTLPHVKSGKLRLLGVTEAKRSALMPDVPTVGETLPGYELGVWYGAFGPPGMPAELVTKLNAEINKAMAIPEVRSRMDAIGVELVRGSPQEFATVLRSDADRYGKVIRELGIKNE